MDRIGRMNEKAYLVHPVLHPVIYLMNDEGIISDTPDATFEFGEKLGAKLTRGDVVLLYGGLGAGKTLLTKGILSSLGFDIDEVTSPSFTLVNLYRTPALDVYHIDLWRLDGAQDAVAAVGLDEIIENENALTIIEWADRLGSAFPEQNDPNKYQGRR